MQWKLRPRFFSGKGPHTLQFKSQDGLAHVLTFEADENGRFETDTVPPHITMGMIGIYAKPILNLR